MASKKTKQIYVLLGDKQTEAEAPEHYIAFTGGHVGVCRTSDDQYWVHVWINHPRHPNGQLLAEIPQQSKWGQLAAIRQYFTDKQTDVERPTDPALYHFAVLITTNKEEQL